MLNRKHLALEQASKWFLRLKDAAPDHADRGKFEAWLMSSAANQQAYQTIADTWEGFDSSEQISQLSSAMLNRKLEEDIRKRQQANKLAKLAAVAVLSLAGLFGWQHWQAQPLQTIAESSGTGSILSRTLPDGSKLTLDAHSHTQVVYYRDKRYVKLLQGQAVFEVVKDAERPFVVESAQARITVKGTRFVVNMVNHKTVVAVDHGKVLVETLQDGATDALLLTDGQVAEVHPRGAPVRRHKLGQDYFAFLQGKLIFDGASLDEVAETVSRYLPQPLVNQSTSHTEISAVVDIKTLPAFIKTLPVVAKVKLQAEEKQTLISDR